jgi:hypothetical protein
MADETCVEVNCCPLGYTVPGLNGTLALSGDDSTATDPNIADGEFVVAEEAKWVSCQIPALNSNTLNAYSTSPIHPQAATTFNNVQIGFYAYAVAICKTFSATLGSANITVNSAQALQVGQIAELATNFFPYGTTILNISGVTITLSNVSLGNTSGSTPIISFRPKTGPITISGNPLIPTGTKVASVSSSIVTLDTATIAPAALTRLVVAFFPAEIDPNVFDEAQLFT